MNLQGNTILITGGGSGIGLGLAVALQAKGNTVIITGRDQGRLEAAVAAHPGLIARQSDVSRADSRAELVAWLREAHPSLNVLFNNAGVMYDWAVQRPGYSPERIDAEIATNLGAPIQLVHALLPHLLQAQRPAIINVSSGVAYAPLPKSPVYSATKAALHSFTLSLRYQLRDTPVKVYEVVPGLVTTAMTGARYDRPERFTTPEGFAEKVLKGLARDVPEIRPGDAAAASVLGKIAPGFLIRYMDKMTRGQEG